MTVSRLRPFSFLVGPGMSVLIALGLFLAGRRSWSNALNAFEQINAELFRLERLIPYPSLENLTRTELHAAEYGSELNKLKNELGRYDPRVSPLAPSEFQSQLRIAVSATVEKAKRRGLRLPDRFYLGFDEYASSLPSEPAAPLLGRELTQIQWIVDLLIEAGAEALTSFKRAPISEEHEPRAAGLGTGSLSRTAENTARSVERDLVEVTFLSGPEVARTVLNRIAGADDRFLIVRLLRIRNEQGKGPPRERAVPDRKPVTLEFIVGEEGIETAATIEIVRFDL